MSVLTFYHRSRTFRVPVHQVSFFRRGIGLMFRTRNTQNLLFPFSRPGRYAITSYFVFFDFLAVFLDSRLRVTEVYRITPFTLTFQPRKKYSYLLELPMNSVNSSLIKRLSRR